MDAVRPSYYGDVGARVHDHSVPALQVPAHEGRQISRVDGLVSNVNDIGVDITGGVNDRVNHCDNR